MARNLTAARPYAKAIFSDANQDGAAESWSPVLQVLAAAASESKVNALLNDPKISHDKWHGFFLSICEQIVPKEVKRLKDKLNNFLLLLVENKRLTLLPDIDLLFHQLLSEQQGITEIEATSAFPLSKSQCTVLKKALEKRLNSKVELNTKTDETLIGGVLVRSRNWVLDASIKGQLTRFKQTLLGLGGK